MPVFSKPISSSSSTQQKQKRPAYAMFKDEGKRSNDPPDPMAWKHPILLAFILSALWARACPIAQRTTMDDDLWDAIPSWQKRWYAHCIPAITWCIMAGQLRCTGKVQYGNAAASAWSGARWSPWREMRSQA